MRKVKNYRPSPDALLNPRIDVIFKALFTQNTEDSNLALMSFISSVIGKEVLSVKLLPEEPNVRDTRDKAVRFDVSCVFNDGLVADIEMQQENNHKEYLKRSEYLASRLLVHSFQAGNKWDKVKPVFQISMVDFNVNEFNVNNNDTNWQNWYVMKEKNRGTTLDEVLNVIFLELTKVRRLLDKTPVEKCHSKAILSIITIKKNRIFS